MLAFLALVAVVIVAVYTGLFGLEILRQKNYPGFIAVMLLALSVFGIPVFVLFFR